MQATPVERDARRHRLGFGQQIRSATLAFAIVVCSLGISFAGDAPVATVPVGASPAVVAVDPVLHYAYVGNYYGDSVTVIDGATRSTVATIPMPTAASIAVPLTGQATRQGTVGWSPTLKMNPYRPEDAKRVIQEVGAVGTPIEYIDRPGSFPRAGEVSELIVNWLNAVIYEIAIRRMLFARFEVCIEGTTLRARAWGEAIDIARHQPAVEIKGATCTSLAVQRDDNGNWSAQCVVDV